MPESMCERSSKGCHTNFNFHINGTTVQISGDPQRPGESIYKVTRNTNDDIRPFEPSLIYRIQSITQVEGSMFPNRKFSVIIDGETLLASELTTTSIAYKRQCVIPLRLDGYGGGMSSEGDFVIKTSARDVEVGRRLLLYPHILSEVIEFHIIPASIYVETKHEVNEHVLIMKRAHGNLRHLLIELNDEEKKLSLSPASMGAIKQAVMYTVYQTLSRLNKLGLVYTDMKPCNVFFEQDTTVTYKSFKIYLGDIGSIIDKEKKLFHSITTTYPFPLIPRTCVDIRHQNFGFLICLLLFLKTDDLVSTTSELRKRSELRDYENEPWFSSIPTTHIERWRAIIALEKVKKPKSSTLRSIVFYYKHFATPYPQQPTRFGKLSNRLLSEDGTHYAEALGMLESKQEKLLQLNDEYLKLIIEVLKPDDARKAISRLNNICHVLLCTYENWK